MQNSRSTDKINLTSSEVLKEHFKHFAGDKRLLSLISYPKIAKISTDLGKIIPFILKYLLLKMHTYEKLKCHTIMEHKTSKSANQFCRIFGNVLSKTSRIFSIEYHGGIASIDGNWRSDKNDSFSYFVIFGTVELPKYVAI